MLEQVETTTFEGPTLRLVNQVSHMEKLRDLGLDPRQIEEMIELLRDRGFTDDPSDVIEGPFANKSLYKTDQTRFSDGTLRVFYSALEAETVEREIRYWYLKPLLQGNVPTRAYYRLARVRFAGDVKDLRPKVEEWPFLVAENGYDACNQLGEEAVESGLAALMSRSARRPDGTTLPVFSKNSLSQVELQGYRVFSYDPENGEVTVSAA